MNGVPIVKQKLLSSLGLLMALGLMVLAGCAEPVTPSTPASRDYMSARVKGTISEFISNKPSIKNLIASAYGYAVLPSIGSGAFVIGGAEGRGQVFEHGRLIGYCKMSSASIGAQIGGQSYSELILFQNAATMAAFKEGETTFDARASAVVAASGGGTAANYVRGVLVYVLPSQGFMAQAAIGGQHFTFAPLLSN